MNECQASVRFLAKIRWKGLLELAFRLEDIPRHLPNPRRYRQTDKEERQTTRYLTVAGKVGEPKGRETERNGEKRRNVGFSSRNRTVGLPRSRPSGGTDIRWLGGACTPMPYVFERW